MSKILNVRFPSFGTGEYDPTKMNQLAAALQQLIGQLNSTYTPISTENNQSELDWFSGNFGPVSRSTLEDRGTFAHGAFFNTTTHTCAAVETATEIDWDTTGYSKHVSVDGADASKIVFAKAGRYKVDFTAQLSSNSANAKTFWFWPRINGADVPGSTMRITVHDNDEAKTVARSGIFEVDNGDYLQAMWAVDDLNTSLQAYSAESYCPAVPSVTLMIMSIQHG